jgi:hypothetical protein
MNKTAKTIAWICLVLGLLGVAVEVGVYVRVRSLITQVREAVEAGEIPAFKEHFADVDGDEDIDKEDWGKSPFDRSGSFAFGGMMDSKRGFDGFYNSRRGLPGMRDGSIGHVGFAFPFLLLASGPVLTVVGAVMLIVNREPKDEDSKEKKVKSKKK